MSFLRPELLPWLLLALIPLVIHLLNRLRYKTVPWAAMMFLIKANQSSTRNARLRHWLILASRCLLLLFFLFAVCRPIIGGWLGGALSGAPEKVILLLDRSASMEQIDPRQQMSKREQAIDLFARAASELGDSTRYILMEHVLREPVEIAGPDALRDLEYTAATDTAADIPALIRSAFYYLQRDPGGRAELWLASDCQTSNWRPESREWQSLMAQLNNLEMDLRIRLIPLSLPPQKNVSVAVNQLKRFVDQRQIEVNVEVFSSQPKTPEFKLAYVSNDRRTPVDISMEQPELRLTQRLPIIGDAKADGWGLIETQADENPADNRSYFVFADPEPARGMVVATRPETRRIGMLSIVPDGVLRFAQNVPFESVDNLGVSTTGLVIWQGGQPDAQTESNLLAFAENGGQVLCFPSAEVNVSGPFGLNWQEIDKTDEETGFNVERWDEDDGPLARTADGTQLRVGDMSIQRRQQIQVDNDWQILADFEDDTPLFLRRVVGQGHIYAFTTLPETDWSLLGDGLVIVPVIQRLLAKGGARNARVRNAVCGEWRPPNTDVNWQPMHSTEFQDPRWTAGVYQSDNLNSEKIALNRPARENDMTYVPREDAIALFGDLPVTALDEGEATAGKSVTSELWRWFIYFALLFMLIEGLLLLADRRPKRSSSGREALRA